MTASDGKKRLTDVAGAVDFTKLLAEVKHAR
jgi:hypothetical protein